MPAVTPVVDSVTTPRGADRNNCEGPPGSPRHLDR
jgi:hypothetical protein